ncbi:MAG: hypothetical protein ACLRQZ_06630 [Clostridia bacterium]
MNEKVTLAGKEYLMEEGIYHHVKENSFERQEDIQDGRIGGRHGSLIPNMAIPK